MDQPVITNMIHNKRTEIHKKKLNKSVSYNLENGNPISHSMEVENPCNLIPSETFKDKKGRENSHRKKKKLNAIEADNSSSKRKFSLKVRKLQVMRKESISNSCPDLKEAFERDKHKISIEVREKVSPVCKCPGSLMIDRNTMELFCDNSPPKQFNLLDINFY